eukprot:2931024-Lingulodinium_polyedra.AAC.1
MQPIHSKVASSPTSDAIDGVLEGRQVRLRGFVPRHTLFEVKPMVVCPLAAVTPTTSQLGWGVG